MASEAGGDARGIGARLRGAREKRGLTILQAAERLHVDARVLEALEAGDFAALGARVYVRGHLRRYAEFLGEPPAELAAVYAGAPGPDLTRGPHREPDRESPLRLPALIVLGVFAAAGVLWWVLTLPGIRPQPVTAQQPAGALPPPAGAVPLPQPGAIALPAGAHLAAAAPAAPAAPAKAQLALKFSAASWVEVYDAGGRRLLAGLGSADTARTLSGVPPLRVVLGNAPAVAMQLNGQPVALDGLVHRDHSARFILDAAGHARRAPPVPGPGG